MNTSLHWDTSEWSSLEVCKTFIEELRAWKNVPEVKKPWRRRMALTKRDIGSFWHGMEGPRAPTQLEWSMQARSWRRWAPKSTCRGPWPCIAYPWDGTHVRGQPLPLVRGCSTSGLPFLEASLHQDRGPVLCIYSTHRIAVLGAACLSSWGSRTKHFSSDEQVSWCKGSANFRAQTCLDQQLS